MNEMPVLTLRGKKEETDFTTFMLEVSNYEKFPDELFSPAPDLPPCGSNQNASRTWVDIYNGTNNQRIYGFCALTCAKDLTSIWFAIQKGQPIPGIVYIKMNDRRTGTIYQSNNLVLMEDATFDDITVYNNSNLLGNLNVKGNVGIGTTTPKAKLDVQGNIHAGNSDIYFTKVDHNHTGFGNTSGYAAIENAKDYNALMILGRATPQGRIVRLWDYLQVNGSMDITGNIGIGTASPDRPLAIRSTGLGQELISFKDPAGNTKWHINQNVGGKSPGLNFVESSVADGRLFIKAGGDVGVGTTTPKAKLDVQGNIHAGNSDIYFTKVDHNHTGFGNTEGYAAIENAKNYDALMILGRTGTQKGRYVRLWDYLQVNGSMDITGKVGIGTTTPRYTLDVNGTINASADVIVGGGDCAEEFDIVDAESIEPGTVMVIDNDGALRASEQAYDKRVAGVISGAGDLRPGITLDKKTNKANRLPLALTGKVYCKVDADCGAVEVGDLLTTSPTYGHAMKVTEHVKSIGAIIGKALKPLEAGCGLIPILVALQ